MDPITDRILTKRKGFLILSNTLNDSLSDLTYTATVCMVILTTCLTEWFSNCMFVELSHDFANGPNLPELLKAWPCVGEHIIL